MNQPYVCIYPLQSHLSRSFTEHRAELPVLHFPPGSVYMSCYLPNSPNSPHLTFPLVISVCVHSLYLHLYSCPEDRMPFFFLDFTCVVYLSLALCIYTAERKTRTLHPIIFWKGSLFFLSFNGPCVGLKSQVLL